MNDRIKKVVILKGNKLKLNKTILSHKNSWIIKSPTLALHQYKLQWQQQKKDTQKM
jgi:hypothetical protein